MRRADNLTTIMCRLSRNLGASSSWNPLALSRPLLGLLYLYLKRVWIRNVANETVHTVTSCMTIMWVCWQGCPICCSVNDAYRIVEMNLMCG